MSNTKLEKTVCPQITAETMGLYELLYNEVTDKFDKETLSRFFPLKGESYSDNDVRLMVIGRSVNGWTALSENTAEEFVHNAIDTIVNDGFSWLRDDGKARDTYIRESDNKECRYNINGSGFFRCTRKILNELKPITKLCDRWFEHIVWSNLYTIAPLHTGNAEGALQYLQVEISQKLLVEQIEYYNPTHILFITDWGYWFENFMEIFTDVKKTGDTLKDNVVGNGIYGNSKVIVTIRPDRTRPSKPTEEAFVKDVVDAFNKITF